MGPETVERMTLLTDEQLMLATCHGDVRKIGELFERHQRPLFNYYLRMTGDRAASEDLVQDVFFRMLRHRQTYKEGAPFQAWMYRIARNTWIDAFRKTKREVGLDREHDDTPDGSLSPADRVAANQETDLLRRALAALPEDKREVLILSRYQNLKYDEIARLLDCGVGAVKQRVFRAIRELREVHSELARRSA